MPVIRLFPLALLAALGSLAAQQTQFGGKYEQLNPRQKELVNLWAVEFTKIFQRPADPRALYDRLPLTARTTFEAVTHALSRSLLTSATGKPLGTALDLVELVERVAGNIPGARGDSQFRVYVYLKPGAADKLYNCREFMRDRDNTVFHIGYPINFRQLGGVPSIQISVARTGRRADIDVDYRPSGGVRALTSGHLTAANSDVRAGDNHARHVQRWEGFAEWWRGLMAGLSGAVSTETADFTPQGHPELERLSRGPLPEMLHAYLTAWLIERQPIGLLAAVSIKAYPCVAEFAGGSRPDSKMALFQILNQLQQVNQRLGKVSRLETAVSPAAYPLPEAEAVTHPYSRLFTVQRVHEDIAWAIDCRIRYGLHLIESIPRPEHRLEETYVVSFRLNEPDTPGFLVQTWQKEAGAWKLVSFDIKRKTLVPPTDLLVRAVNRSGAASAPPALQSAVDTFLTRWLIDRKLDAAAAAFLPESCACSAAPESQPSAPAPGANVREFLQEVVSQSSREKTLDRTLSAPQAAHPDLKPLSHPRSGAYLLAEVSPELMRTSACAAPPNPTVRPPALPAAAGVLTAFHLSRSKQVSAGIVSLYWKNLNGEWRIAAFTVASD